MFQRIFVAVDGSELSTAALEAAVDLVKGSAAQLRIVHVVDETNINVETEEAYQSFVRLCRRAGQAVIDEAQGIATRSGITSEASLIELEGRRARICDAIADAAKAWSADLIVMGTHGRRGVHRLLLGSVAEGVTRIAHASTLLVRRT